MCPLEAFCLLLCSCCAAAAQQTENEKLLCSASAHAACLAGWLAPPSPAALSASGCGNAEALAGRNHPVDGRTDGRRIEPARGSSSRIDKEAEADRGAIAGRPTLTSASQSHKNTRNAPAVAAANDVERREKWRLSRAGEHTGCRRRRRYYY